MNKKEILFLLSATIIAYILLFVIRSFIPLIVLNIVLITFYTSFLFKKLPIWCYSKGNKQVGKNEYVTIGAGLFYLLCCILAYLFPDHDKLFARIGFLSFFFVIFCFLIATYFKRLLSDLPKETFVQNHKLYFRTVLIFLTNILLVSTCTYSNKTQYKGGRLYSKTIIDGMDEYHTEYVDSLDNYVTHVKKYGNSHSEYNRIEYDIYYYVYPDKISHIDTTYIKRR